MNEACPTFFSSSALFRGWLQKNSATAKELVVGFWKVDSGKPSMSWSESVDEALCFGWIDGVRRRIDEHSYQIRFTPRKPRSVWSAVNIEKCERLIAAGKMTQAGKEAFDRRLQESSSVYSYEQAESAKLTEVEEMQFRRNRSAWQYFEDCPPSYRKTILHWITSAKKPETRAKRLLQLVQCSAEGKRLK